MTVPLLPNPNTSLAWLPPNIASEVEISRYIIIAVYSAWLWDGLMTIPEDIKLFRKFSFSLTDAVYIFARLSVLGSLTATVLFAVAPIDNCVALGKACGWLSAILLPPNAFLFLIRIRAVFHDSKLIVCAFLFLWLAVIGGGLVQPFCLKAAHIGLSKNCTLTVVRPYCSSGAVVVAVHDTLVLIAISTRLLVYSMADTWTGRLRVFFSGKGMPHLSRLLLQTGQQYYIATAAINIFTVVVLFTPSISPVYRAIVTTPDLAIYNVMACRVYRKVKLGAITNGMTTTFSTSGITPRGSSSIRFAAPIALKARTSSSIDTNERPKKFDPESTIQHMPPRPELVQGEEGVGVRLDLGYPQVEGGLVPPGCEVPRGNDVVVTVTKVGNFV